MQATVTELQEAIYEAKNKASKYQTNRQRLTLPPGPGEKSGKALEAGKPLVSYGLLNGSKIQYKDLGLQVWLHC